MSACERRSGSRRRRSLVLGAGRRSGRRRLGRRSAASADHRRRVVVRRARDRPVAGRHRAASRTRSRSTTWRRVDVRAHGVHHGNLDFGASDIMFQPVGDPPLQVEALRRASRPTTGLLRVRPGERGRARVHVQPPRRRRPNRVRDLKLTRAGRVQDLHRRDQEVERPRDRRDEPAARRLRPSTSSPVIRADGAGESYVFSEFCIAVADDVWTEFIAERQRNDPSERRRGLRRTSAGVELAAGLGPTRKPSAVRRRNAPTRSPDPVRREGRDHLRRGRRTRRSRSFPVASLQNAAGVYTQPDEENVTVALGYARPGAATERSASTSPATRPAGVLPVDVLVRARADDRLRPREGRDDSGSSLLRGERGASGGGAVALRACVGARSSRSRSTRSTRSRGAPTDVLFVLRRGRRAAATTANGRRPGGPVVPIGPGGPGNNGNNGNTAATAERQQRRRRRDDDDPCRLDVDGNGATTDNGATEGTGEEGVDLVAQQEAIDDRLAAEVGAQPESESVSGIWVLLAGVVLAWIVSVFVARKRSRV